MQPIDSYDNSAILAAAEKPIAILSSDLLGTSFNNVRISIGIVPFQSP